MSIRAQAKCKSLYDRLENRQWCLWFDNYFRKRYVPVPGEDNRSLNCTAFALLQLDRPLDVLPPLPSAGELWAQCSNWATRMAQRHFDLLSGIELLISSTVPLHSVRAPLDIKRQQVSSPQWEAFLLMDLKVSSTPDLVEILHEVQKLEARIAHHLPLLVDENIHCRILKLAYSVTYAESNVPLYLNRTPILYGVWHPYKYAVTLT